MIHELPETSRDNIRSSSLKSRTVDNAMKFITANTERLQFYIDCPHNELRIIYGTIQCKCGKDWIAVPDANESETTFKATLMAIEKASPEQVLQMYSATE